MGMQLNWKTKQPGWFQQANGFTLSEPLPIVLSCGSQAETPTAGPKQIKACSEGNSLDDAPHPEHERADGGVVGLLLQVVAGEVRLLQVRLHHVQRALRQLHLVERPQLLAESEEDKTDSARHLQGSKLKKSSRSWRLRTRTLVANSRVLVAILRL